MPGPRLERQRGPKSEVRLRQGQLQKSGDTFYSRGSGHARASAATSGQLEDPSMSSFGSSWHISQCRGLKSKLKC